MNLIYEVDKNNNLTYLGTGSGGNYISSPLELEIISDKPEKDKVLPFGAVNVRGKKCAHGSGCAVDFQNANEASAVGGLKINREWKLSGDELIFDLTVQNSATCPIEIGELSVSVPLNNNYTRFMYDQDFMYARRTCEHYYISGANSYIIAEKLNGRAPILYALCGEGTSVEHIRKAPFTAERHNRGLINHSYPGSLEAMFVSGYAMEELGNRAPVTGSKVILAPNESANYSLRFGFADSRAAFDKIRITCGHAVFRPVSGLTGPGELPFEFEFFGGNGFELCADDAELKKITETLYSAKFCGAGIHRIEARDNNGVCSYITFYVTESPEKLIRSRANFILHKQVYRNEGDILDNAILPYSDGRPFCGKTGIVAEEGSLWGTGSYEGGITDAGFAAEKNVLYPDAEEVSLLDEYAEKYLLRYLQDPETLKVNWFGYRVAEDRSYNYVHVANFWFSMYKIAELHGITAKDRFYYLDLAARTLTVMFSVGRAMDLIVGNLNMGVVEEVLSAFAREGSIDRYFDLKLRYMRYMDNVFFDTPYASECPYDNTGYESVIRCCIRRGDKKTALELSDIIRTNKGNQPVWHWNGSDIRWWDAEFDFSECCHHYTSPLNGAALLELMTETDWLEPSTELLSSAYGGILGVFAKIRPDGFASMSYCPEPVSSENYGFHRCTGDFGVGGIALLKNLTAASMEKNGRRYDYFCGGEGAKYIFPNNVVRNFCKFGSDKLTVKVEGTFLKAITAEGNEAVIEVSENKKCRIDITSKRRVKTFENCKMYETGEGKYAIEIAPSGKDVSKEPLFAKIIFA